MSKLFGKLFGGGKRKPLTRATSFETLPGFAQDVSREAAEAQQQAILQARGLATQPGLFGAVGFTPEQEQAAQFFGQEVAPTTAAQFQQGLSTFGDPFEEQVVQGAIRDITEAGRGQFGDIGTLASEAGGFGGTRQALLESELQRNLQRNIGNISGQLRSQGFQSAAQRTLDDLGRAQDVGTQRAGSLFNIGGARRGLQQQTQQAPIAAASFLQGFGGLPQIGGGDISFRPAQEGLIDRFTGPARRIVSSLGGGEGVAAALGGF